MSDRGQVEATLRALYEARGRGDTAAIMAHFTPDVHFSINGSPAARPIPLTVRGAAEVAEVAEQLIAAFEFRDIELLDIVVDRDRAVVHWRVNVRAPATGKEAETEIVDMFTLRDGKISSYRQFADTALASQLVGAA